MPGRAGPAPCPLPPRSVGGAVGGEGGGGLVKHVLPGDSERGKGGSLARKFGGSYSRVDLACFHGKTFWHIYLAGFHKQ